MLEVRCIIPEQPLVREIFSLQHPEGYWGEDESKPYKAQGAVAALFAAAHAGRAAGAKRTVRRLQLLLEILPERQRRLIPDAARCAAASSPVPRASTCPSWSISASASNHGCARLLPFLIEDMSTPDALDCGRYAHRDCLWGAIAALNGLSVLPAGDALGPVRWRGETPGRRPVGCGL